MKISEVTLVDGKRVVVDASLNNAALLKEFGEQLKTGRVVVVAIAPAIDRRDSGRDLFNVFFAQQRQGDFGMDLDSDADRVGLGEFWAEGLVDTPVIRTQQVMAMPLIQKLELDQKALLPEWVNIHQRDSIIPESDIEERNPRLTKANEQGVQHVMVNANGRPIFRRSFLTPKPGDETPLDQPRAYRRSKISYQTYMRDTVARQDEKAQKQAAELAVNQPAVVEEPGVVAAQ